MNLYELSLEGMQIQDILIANDGELTPELEARMDALLIQGPERVEAAAMVVRGLEAEAEACKAEYARLRARAESFENQAEHLKSRITFALDAAFSGKVKTPRFTIWAQSSAPTVQFALKDGASIEDLERDWPGAVKIQRSLSKEALLKLHKGGVFPVTIEAIEQPGTRYLRIK